MTTLPKPPDLAPAGWQEKPVSLWSYATVLLRWGRLVIVLPLAGALVAGVISLSTPREYRASASFVPQDPAASQPGLSLLASQFGISVPRASTTSPQFYADLLASREILRGVVETPYAALQRPGRTGDLVEYFNIRSADRDAAVIDAVRSLRETMRVRTDRNTGVVHFEVHTPDPALSLQIADRLVELVNDFNLRRRQSQARAEREFVEQRLALAQDSLRAAEEALAAFFRSNRRFSDSPTLVGEEARLQRQVNLRQQVYVTLAQSHEAAKVEEVRNTAVITVIERPQGFVEPEPRGTIRKVIVGMFLGGFLAFGIAFGAEYARRAREAGPEDFQEFVTLSRGVLGSLRSGGLFRRHPR
jgi:uncharacterized protein involved in exopolysaccharide biosynthesis